MTYEGTGKPIEILLVEDNPADARLFAEALTCGTLVAKLNIVQDGEAALDYLYKRGDYSNASTPQVVFLDLNLPKRSGHEVLERLKNDDSLKRTVVMVLTSSTAANDINRSYELYANGYLTKPSDLDEFLEVMESISYLLRTVAKIPEPEASATPSPAKESVTP